MIGRPRNTSPENLPGTNIGSSLIASIVNGLPFAMLALDRRARVIAANLQAEKAFGYAGTKMAGMEIGKLLPECSLPGACKNNSEQGRLHRVTGRRNDGSEFRIDIGIHVNDIEGEQITFIDLLDIERRSLYEGEIDRLKKLYQTLSQLNQMLIKATSREEVLNEVCRIIADGVGFRLVWVGCPNAETREIYPVARAGAQAGYLDRAKAYLDERPGGLGPAGVSMRENRTVVFDTFPNETSSAVWREIAIEHGFKSAAAFPIRKNGLPVGTIAVYGNETNAFTNDEVGLLEEAAGDVSFALEHLEHLDKEREAMVQLRAQETLLEEMGAMAKVGGWEIDLSTGKVRWTQQLAGLHGFDKTYEIALATVMEHYSPHSRALLQQALDAATQHGTGYDLELEYLPVNGKKKWIRAIGQAVVVEGVTVGIKGSSQDITELKEIAEALKASELKYRTIYENSFEGLFRLSNDLKFLDVNDSYARMYGYSSKEDLLAKASSLSDAVILKPEDVKRIRETLSRDGVINGLEVSFTKRDGTKGWVLLSSRLVRGEQGEVRYREGSVRDITAQREADEQIRILSRAVDQSPVSIVITDTKGNIEYVNPKFIEVTGYTLAEVEGQNPRVLKSGTTPPERYAELWKTLGAGGTWHGEFCNKKKNGELFWEYASISPIIDESGAVVRYVAVKEDITGRKLKDEALRKSEQKYRSIYENSIEGIFRLDLNNKFLELNPACARSLGLKEEELSTGISRVLDEVITINPVHRARIGALLASEGIIRDEEVAYRRHDGKDSWCLLSLRYECDAAGNRLFLEGTLVDVTARKQMEAHLLRTQRLESIGTLASGIAHDLNNVLGPIMMAIQILRERHQDRESQSILTTLETSAHRGAGIVKQVLTFARGVEGERILLEPKHLLKEIRSIVNETFPRSINLEMDIQAGLSLVQGDVTQLHQVILNLCVNARDAMPSGGLLRIIATDEHVDEKKASRNPGTKPGKFVVVTVVDSGTGIPPEVVQRIFDPFFTTKEVGKGTGLGLSSALGIVRSHGGFIEVESAPGSGTSFKVYLPAAESDAEFKENVDIEYLFAGHGRILVIDDEEAICLITKATLEAVGYEVHTAESGIEAIQFFSGKWQEIDVVITDFMMPLMDGEATIRALRTINPKVKVIITSGLAEKIDLARIESLRANASLTKPFAAETLLRTLRDILLE